MSTVDTNKLNVQSVVKWVVSIIVPLAIYFIPENAVFTSQIKWFTIGTVWLLLCCALEIMNIIIPAFLTPVIWSLSGAAKPAIAWSGWSTEIMWVIVGAFLLAGALDQCGLLERISIWIIVRIGGTLTKTCWALFLIGFILSVITFSNAYVVMATFTYGVAKALRVNMPSKEGLVLLMSASIGVLSTRMFIYAPSVILMLQQGASAFFPGYTLPWYDYMFHNIPVLFFLLLFVWLMTKMYKTDSYAGNIDLDTYRTDLAKRGPISSKEKKAIIALALLMVILFSSPVTKLSTSIPFLLIPILMYLPGVAIADERAYKNSVDFAMLCFIAACIGIGNVGASLGVGEIIVNVFSPMLMGKSVTVTLLGMLIFGTLANFLMTPTAMLVSLSGPLAVISESIGLPITSAMYALAHATDLIFLPYEFVPYLIFFSFGFCSMADFLKINTLRVFVYFIFFVVVMIPYWNLVGLL